MPFNRVTVEIQHSFKEILIAEVSGDDFAGAWERNKFQGRIELNLYFSDVSCLTELEDRVKNVFERLGESIPRVTSYLEEDLDWSKKWRENYTSFNLSKTFRVVPSRLEIESASYVKNVIRIDPGQAFGSGTHESTQMVVTAMEQCRVKVERVLDLGTGSGILSIAASRLGWRSVLACDLDPDAVNVAMDNFRKNLVPVNLFLGSVDCISSSSVGLLLANLSLNEIRSLLPGIQRILKSNGKAILSGILEIHSGSLCSLLLENGFSIEKEQIRGEWFSCVAQYDN